VFSYTFSSDFFIAFRVKEITYIVGHFDKSFYFHR